MDVREVAAVHQVEDPGCHGGTEVPMQGGHRSVLDASLPSRTHYELVSLAKLLQERGQLPEVVGAIGVAHQDVFAANEGECVDVRAAETAAGSLQYAGSMFAGDLSSPVAA